MVPLVRLGPVVPVDPLAGGAGVALQLVPEAHAVEGACEGAVFGEVDAGRVGHRRQDVGDVDEVGDDATLALSRHVRDQRGPGAAVGGHRLAAVDGLPAELRHDRARRAVVGGEQQEGVVEQAEGVELVVDEAHVVVGPADHLLVGARAAVVGAAAAVGWQHEGNVRQHHRVVGEERAVLVGLDEVQQEVHEDVGPVVGGCCVDERAVALDRRIPVPGTDARTGQVGEPQAVAVESLARVLGSDVRCNQTLVAVQLPLAGDGCGVAGVAEEVTEGVRASHHRDPVVVVADIALAGHDRVPARRAQRRGERVVEAGAARRDRVEPGRGVLGAAVRAEHLVARVVGHDHHNVGIVDVAHGHSDVD